MPGERRATSCAADRRRPHEREHARGSDRAASRRMISTSADSTRGRDEHRGGTSPTTAGAGPVGHLHRHGPVPRRAGPAARRSPTSRCTITSIRTIPARRRAGRTAAAWPRCRAGWPPAPTARSPISAPQSRRIASASTTVTAGWPATTSRSAVASPASTSTATTWAPGLDQRQRQRTRARRRPRPRGPGPTPARAAMRRTVFGSATSSGRARAGGQAAVASRSRTAGREWVTRTGGSRRGSGRRSGRRSAGTWCRG